MGMKDWFKKKRNDQSFYDLSKEVNKYIDSQRLKVLYEVKSKAVGKDYLWREDVLKADGLKYDEDAFVIINKRVFEQLLLKYGDDKK